MDAILHILTLQKRTMYLIFFFWLLMHLSNIFAPYIKKLEMYFAILICFEFWPLCVLAVEACSLYFLLSIKQYRPNSEKCTIVHSLLKGQSCKKCPCVEGITSPWGPLRDTSAFVSETLGLSQVIKHEYWFNDWVSFF